MDREIAPEVRQRRVVKRVAMVIALVVIAGFSLAATVEWVRPSLKKNEIRTARVERRPVEATVDATGTVVPLVEQVVSSPVEARVVRIGRRAGEQVHAGDELLTLDTGAARLDAERLAERVAQKENELARLRLTLDETKASLSAQLEQKRLDAQILHYTAEQKAKLRADGLAAEQETLAANAAAKKSDIEIRQLEQALARAQTSSVAQLAATEMDVRIARRERDEAARQLELAMLRADRDGVLTWVVSEEGATVRRGDVVARVADLSTYRIVATISDIHAARLAAGQHAIVKLDDATRIDGTISSVDPRIENGVARFWISLATPSHPKLRNNLRADVSVVTGTRGNVLSVTRGALAQSDNSHAFVVRGDELVRANVRYGLSGNDRIEIEGLNEGDEVVISDMTDFADVKKVRIR